MMLRCEFGQPFRQLLAQTLHLGLTAGAGLPCRNSFLLYWEAVCVIWAKLRIRSVMHNFDLGQRLSNFP